jgi:AraC-like DNA-binding protein
LPKHYSMDIQVHVPHPGLQEFVVALTTIDAPLPVEYDEAVSPYPPAPLQSIIFYGENRIHMSNYGQADYHAQPSIVVVGPQYSRVNIKVIKKLRAVRVDFRPGGLFRLLGIPMTELFDKGVDAVDIFGNEARQLNEQILNTANLTACKVLIERFLLKKRTSLTVALPFDRALQILLQSDGNTAIEKIASLSCLSLRQFERKCVTRLGMSPKAFARIARFSKAYRLRESNRDLTWACIAYEAGYFDQMHLIRDFKQFAGVTPSFIDNALSETPFRMQADLII